MAKPNNWQFPAEPDRLVSRLCLYRPKETWQRLDVAPFAVAYFVLHAWTTVAALTGGEGCIFTGDHLCLSAPHQRPSPPTLTRTPLTLW